MRDRRDSLRSAGTWRSVVRAMVAAGAVRFLVRLALLAVVGLILVAMGWEAGWSGL